MRYGILIAVRSSLKQLRDRGRLFELISDEMLRTKVQRVGLQLQTSFTDLATVAPEQHSLKRAKAKGTFFSWISSLSDKAMTFRMMCVAILVIAAHLLPTDAAVRVWGLRAFNLDGDPTGPPDPYVKVWCGSTFGGMTDFRQDNANPIWSSEFNFPKCKAKDILKLEVWDKDLIYDDQLGTCTLKVQSGTYVYLNCIVGRGRLSYNYELK
ncbi:hypothetical protein AOLI_G00275700 [Acnodon oligacanthus]